MVQNVLTVSDFDKILDSYAGQELTLIPVTKSISNLSGQETLTEGTPTTIKCYFMRTMQNWDFAKAGFVEKGDAVALVKFGDNVSKDDILKFKEVKYRVGEAFNVPGVFDSTGSTTEYVYTSCNLFLYE